ncbi:MAG: MgtC/SapB family protein [Pseudomonas formosensis]|nr:MgtC/SapB family protein [Halopseudomonas formosensis]
MNGLGYDIELTGLLIALAVGLIIGFERGWQSQNLDGARHEEIDDQTVTGIRTFGLLGLPAG